mmetsp:Transcript_49266/g.76934  ORF Transcript_49266/g.76934 Transcript_49266/m.76934 type:complete len:510 (+) Transcript_49266:106-1635(+)
MLRVVLLFAAVLGTQAAAGTSEDPCVPSSGMGTEADPYIFKSKVNFFVSSTGYYEFENCDAARPVLKMMAMKHYKFDQSDNSNWMHPFGFAYFPDGAYGRDGMQDELELGMTPPGSSSTCADDNSCQSPMYYNGDTFLRSENGYQLAARRRRNGNRKLLEESGGEDEPYVAAADFGLDNYEPQFFLPFERWVEEGEGGGGWNVRLMVNDDKTTFFYYFCHIHRYMSGVIEVYNEDGTKRDLAMNGAGTQESQFFYEPYKPTAREEICGYTAEPHYDDLKGPGMFQTDSGKCDNRALCGNEDDFKMCMEDIDCHMEYNMRVPHSNNKVATFCRQMIGHHQNAVNMVKVMWKHASAEVEAAGFDPMMHEIHNSQNHQIMAMYDWLREHQNKDWAEAEVYDEDCAKDLEHSSFGDWNAAGTGFAVGFVLASVFALGVFYMSKASAASQTGTGVNMPSKDVEGFSPSAAPSLPAAAPSLSAAAQSMPSAAPYVQAVPQQYGFQQQTGYPQQTA